MKKIFKIFVCLIYLLTIECKVYADDKSQSGIGADNESFGYSSSTGSGPCGEYDGCGSYTNGFVLRMGLFTIEDISLKPVEGTKVIQFRHNSEDSYKRTYSYNIDAYEFTEDYWKEYKNKNGTPMITSTDGEFPSVEIVLGGMATFEEIHDYQSGWFREKKIDGPNEEYITNLGIGKGAEESFESAQANRKKMMDYIMSQEKRNKVPGEDKYVSFLEFFLHVCGFNEDWEINSNIRRELAEKRYYIVIEPVYSYSTFFTDKNGTRGWHTIEGTAKQLADFALYKLEKNDTQLWIPYSSEIIYNHLCNFQDKTAAGMYGYGGFNFNYNELCANYNFFENFYNNLDFKEYDRSSSWGLFNDLATPSTAAGVNVISLYKNGDKIENDYECKYAVSTCNDNGFVYQTQLQLNSKSQSSQEEIINKYGLKETTGISSAVSGRFTDADSLYNCIKPIGIDESEISKYIYTIGTDENKLWCYDNVIYDFTPLLNLQDKIYSSNQLIEIPDGKLTVKRTCYTTSENIPDETLNTVFNQDFTETWRNNNYQKEFNFKFNNTNYKFIRDIDKGIEHEYDPQTNKTYTISDTRNVARRLQKRIYTSTFSYNYKLNNSINKNSNIDINGFNINAGLQETNSIKFITKYKNISTSLIKQNKINEEGQVENSISAQLKNAYGLSNKIVNEINGLNRIFGLITGSTTTIENDKYHSWTRTLNSNLKYTFEKSDDDSCEFSTELQKLDISKYVKFRTISLDNPFPARDGSLRIAGRNWANEETNNIYNYIQNNRNVKTEQVYSKKPLYKITLTPQSMTQIREYNKTYSYSTYEITCEKGTGRQCISSFLRTKKYVNDISGECASILSADEITERNNEIIEYLSHCRNCTDSQYDTNHNGIVNTDDYLTSKYYECADKKAQSGG